MPAGVGGGELPTYNGANARSTILEYEREKLDDILAKFNAQRREVVQSALDEADRDLRQAVLGEQQAAAGDRYDTAKKSFSVRSHEPSNNP